MAMHSSEKGVLPVCQPAQAIAVFRAALLEGASTHDLKDLHGKVFSSKGDSQTRNELATAIAQELAPILKSWRHHFPHVPGMRSSVLRSVIPETIPSASKETLKSMTKDEIMRWLEESAEGATAAHSTHDIHGSSGGGLGDDNVGRDDPDGEGEDGDAHLERKQHKSVFSPSGNLESFDRGLL